MIYIAPVDAIGSAHTPWRRVASVGDDATSVALHGDDLYLFTFKGAPLQTAQSTSRSS